jgi:hypothetical protein
MNITIRVTRNDNTYDVQTNLMVVVLWERKYKMRASDLASGVAMEHLAYMAYEASKMASVVVPVSFDQFIKECSALEVVDSENPNPTESAATADN